MIKKFLIVWLAVLLTLVPYAIYYLLFLAPPDQYVALFVFIFFWIFGYWSLAGAIISVVKIRKIFNAMEKAKSVGELKTVVQSPEAREVAVDLIASDNHVPKFIARRVYDLIVKKLSRTSENNQAIMADKKF